MGYLGLVPSESSTGDTVSRGGITTAGNGRARRILVEAAWSYRHPPRVSREKQIKVAAAPRAAREIAWKAQMRLCGRFRSLTRKGKRPTVVATAIARVADHMIDARSRQGQPRTNKRQCGIQPAHQSLITDVFRSRPLLCTIHHLINSTLASVENVPVVPAVLDKGHQSKRTRWAGWRRVRVGPLPDSCIAAIASYSITSSALTSSAGDVIRHRRRLFFPRVFPRVLVEHAQHGERHGLNPGLDGRLRHRREQGRVVARQLRTFALAGGSDALRLVDADSEEHRGHASVDELRIIFAGRDNGLNLSPNAAFSTLQPRRDH